MACELERDPTRYAAVLERAFDRHYAERSDVWTDDPAMRVFPALVQGRLKLPAATRVLDVGCGAGRDVELLARTFEAVTGLDLYAHADWSDIARRAPNARFIAAPLLAWESDERFDLVLDNGCFHHQHPEHVRAYLARVLVLLAPGGHVVLSTFKNPSLKERVDDYGRLHRYYTDGELHAELAAAGLGVDGELDVWRVRHRDYYRLSFCRASRA